jgi:hypothetical protein
MAGQAVKGYFVALMLTLAWGTLAFGAVYAWAYWPLAAACAALGTWGIVRRRAWRSDRARHLGLALAAVGVVMIIQLVPVPIGLLKAIAPGADHFLAQFNLAYAFQPPAWHSLSVAPAETRTALLLLVALGVLLVGLSAVLGRLDVKHVVLALAVFGVMVAVVGVFNRALNGDDVHARIYGFWQPEQAAQPFPPFVNPNHYAGWMVLAIAPTLGYLCGLVEASWDARGRRLSSWLLWLARPDAGRLALLGLCVLAMTTALVLTGSRSGIASLAAVLAVVGFRAVRRSERTMPKVVAVAAASALLAGAFLWADSRTLAVKLSHTSHDESAYGRLQVWHDALAIARDFPVFGSGMGTFGEVMVVYQSGARAAAFTQAHNDYLQILAEGGALMAAAALGFIAVVGIGAAQRLRQDSDLVTNWIRYGAVAGLIGIAGQSMVEFSLQMPGITVLFVVVAALALHRPSDRTAHAHRM